MLQYSIVAKRNMFYKIFSCEVETATVEYKKVQEMIVTNSKENISPKCIKLLNLKQKKRKD